MADIHSYEPLFEHWRIDGEPIGAGSYGIVYKARRVLGQHEYFCAIKHISYPKDKAELIALKSEIGDNPEDLKIFYDAGLNSILDEFDIQQRFVNQSNFVQIYDVIYYPKTDMPGYDIFIRMELLNSINPRISSCEDRETEVLKLGIDICSALSVMEKKHYLHRDIKPQNILVSAEGTYKLADFGTTRSIKGDMTYLSIKGTLDYIAPEVILGKPTGFTSDIYSLGMVMYQLMNNGKLPFIAEMVTSDAAFGMRLSGKNMEPPKQATSDLSKIILKACAFDPEKRWEKADDMMTALNALLDRSRYANNCIVEMPVNAKIESDQVERRLVADKTNYTRSNDNRVNDNQCQNSKIIENAFEQDIRTNEPGDESKQEFKTDTVIFDTIKDNKATECAKQGRTLGKQEKQKQLYTYNVTVHHNDLDKSKDLEDEPKAFQPVPQYKDAKTQTQKYEEKIEEIRSGKYNTAVNTMKEAGNSSIKWEKAMNELADNELTNYRDVIQLRARAAKRYGECLAAEMETQRRKEEIARREAENAATRKRNIIWGIIAAVIVVVIVLIKVIIPNNIYEEAKHLRADGKYAEAVAMFAELGAYNDSATQIGATYYAEGEAKRNAQDWMGSVEAFANAGSYGDAATQIGATYYAEGEVKRNAQDWTGAEEAFANAGNYSDAATQCTETQYQHAQTLIAKKDYVGAATILINIKDYKDIDRLLTNDHNLSQAAAAVVREPFTKVGNIVTYGHYEQDNDIGNGKEAIEWIVIEYDSTTGQSLLLSRYGLDTRCFDASIYQGWDKSEMRNWLNSTFLNNAFTAKEQEGIVTTKISTPNRGRYSGGPDSQDMIWLLSRDEAETYLKNNEARKAIPTEYAVPEGTVAIVDSWLNGIPCCSWWLRSPGSWSDEASIVDTDGYLSIAEVRRTGHSVRPVFLLNLDSADIHY